MNPDTNQFEMIPDSQQPDPKLIPFAIDEELEIKGHIFKVVHIDIPGPAEPSRQHLLVLAPVRKP